MNEQTSASKKITLGLALSWIFGSLFTIGGIGQLFINPLIGIVFLVIASVILPPAINYIEKKWNIQLSGGLKAVIIIVGLIIVGSFSEKTNINTPQKQVNYQQSNTYIKESKSVKNGTVSQINALAKAKQYLSVMAFSYNGLIQQLEYDQFSNADAKYGVDNCGADWNEQAAKKAKNYMNTMAFSRGGLIDQLKFDGFTEAQAKYGADAVGL